MTGTERIRGCFEQARSEGRGALIGYVMGGDPDIARSAAYVRALAEGGADLIEVGIPFSDPVADGPTIQAASVRALDGGVRPGDVLTMIKGLRDEGLKVPIVVMTYANIPYVRGYDAWAQALAAHGVDGQIIPDVPVDEAGPLSAALDAEGLANILLAAPLSRGDRLARIASASRGFLYLVGTFGTTGARDELAPETLELLGGVLPTAHDAGIPLAVGFGVSKPEHVRQLVAAGADGVVVGSALVAQVAAGVEPSVLAEQVRTLATGLKP